MAKSYTERNNESLRETGKTLYQRRIEKAQAKGLTRAQARGHARTHKGEKPASAVRQTRPSVVRNKPPKIEKRVQKMKGDARIVTTYSSKVVEKQLNSVPDNRRVYLSVWDKREKNGVAGKFVDIYQGSRNRPHGITAGELKRRINARIASGQAKDFNQGLRQTIAADSAAHGGGEGYGDDDIPEDFSQIELDVFSDRMSAV